MKIVEFPQQDDKAKTGAIKMFQDMKERAERDEIDSAIVIGSSEDGGMFIGVNNLNYVEAMGMIAIALKSLE